MNHTIPDSLVRYQQALEEATRRDLAGTVAQHRRRRLGLRFAVAGGATAAIALGALSLLVSGAPSTVVPAAAAVIHHAAAALTETPGTIWHVKTTATQDNGDGTTVSWSQESYAEPRPPYDSRQISIYGAGTPAGVEQATVNGVPQLYDPGQNTIYIGAPPSQTDRAQSNPKVPRYRFTAGPRAGTYRVRVAVAYGLVRRSGRVAHVKTMYRTLVVPSAEARALRKGTDIINWTYHKRGTQFTDPRVVHVTRKAASDNPDDVDPFSSLFRGQILALLRSGHARIVGPVTVDGRDAIEIASADGHTTYYVAPGSYAPVELSTRGTSGGVVMRFDTYEQLPLEGNGELLSLTAQHPTAAIDHSVADYNAAEKRLFPLG